MDYIESIDQYGFQPTPIIRLKNRSNSQYKTVLGGSLTMIVRILFVW